MADPDDEADDTETSLWRSTVEALLTKGSSPAEAIDGANLILDVYRRRRDDQGDPRQSGTRARARRRT
jgi:hypothetical protein